MVSATAIATSTAVDAAIPRSARTARGDREDGELRQSQRPRARAVPELAQKKTWASGTAPAREREDRP
jgi:hypothetical protein